MDCTDFGKNAWSCEIMLIKVSIRTNVMTDHVKPLDTVLHQAEVLEVVKDGEDAIDILKIILIE